MLIWTMVLLAAAILVIGEATTSLYTRQQACFFNYPSVPCPTGSDPAVVRMTLAFFALPAIWFVGIVAGFTVRELRRRRRLR